MIGNIDIYFTYSFHEKLYFRYEKVIEEIVGCQDDDEMRQKCRLYGSQVALKSEQVFRGFVVSTLTCQDCKHSSSRHEGFFELSVPINVNKPEPESAPCKVHCKNPMKRLRKKSWSETDSDSDSDFSGNTSINTDYLPRNLFAEGEGSPSSESELVDFIGNFIFELYVPRSN